jgi:hypothetical protein
MDVRALCDPLPGSNSFATFNPGCSSHSLLDPGLLAPIPAGIKKHADKIESLKALL